MRHCAKNVRDGAENMRDGAENVWHGGKNVRHGAENMRHCVKNVWHGAENVRHDTKYVRHGAKNVQYTRIFQKQTNDLPLQKECRPMIKICFTSSTPPVAIRDKMEVIYISIFNNILNTDIFWNEKD